MTDLAGNALKFTDAGEVALTASATEDVRSRCLSSGMDDVLTKPLAATELRAILETWLPKGS